MRVRPDVAERWQEFTFRRAIPGLTHDEYLDEPAELVDWFVKFLELEQEIQEEQLRRDAG